MMNEHQSVLKVKNLIGILMSADQEMPVHIPLEGDDLTQQTIPAVGIAHFPDRVVISGVCGCPDQH